jgi:hypothetical protein
LRDSIVSPHFKAKPDNYDYLVLLILIPMQLISPRNDLLSLSEFTASTLDDIAAPSLAAGTGSTNAKPDQRLRALASKYADAPAPTLELDLRCIIT